MSWPILSCLESRRWYPGDGLGLVSQCSTHACGFNKLGQMNVAIAMDLYVIYTWTSGAVSAATSTVNGASVVLRFGMHVLL